MNYVRAIKPGNVPQTTKALPNQVRNNAGGYAFKVEDFDRLVKFITIGTEGGTYYVDEQKLTKAEAEATIRVLRSEPTLAVDEIVDVLSKNRAHKRNAALFALALSVDPEIVPDAEARSYTFSKLPSVLRTGTDLFIFVGYVAQLRGKGGQGLQKALSRWYADRDADSLAYQLMKYQAREGWSHRDVLRIARPGAGKRAKITDPDSRALVRWALSGFDSASDRVEISEGTSRELPARVKAVNLLRREQATLAPKEVARLIRAQNLPREVIPTQFLNEEIVWQELIKKMPMLGTVRNLGAISSKGFLDRFSDIEKTILERLNDGAQVHASGIHPFHLLLAARTYRQGRGERGTNTWRVNQEVNAALDTALKASLRNPTPSGKNILVAIDISASMRSVADKAYTLAYCFKSIEPQAQVIEFDQATSGYGYGWGRGSVKTSAGIAGVYDSNISANSNLDQVLSNINYGGGTDVSLPFQYIKAKGLEKKVDAVIMLTDSESWAGGRHTFQLVDEIRKVNPDFKAVEVQLAPGYHKQLRGHKNELLVSGFDASVYGVVSEFIAQ